MKQLKGSEKQIAWAEKIRTNIINEIKEQYFDEYTVGVMLRQNPEKQAEGNEALEKIENIDSASWWIDHREVAMQHIFKDAIKDRLFK